MSILDLQGKATRNGGGDQDEASNVSVLCDGDSGLSIGCS
jgi:hypothetical protein